MFCDFCNSISYSMQTTVRITKDGQEIIIEYCGNCLRKTETEYDKKGSTVHIKETSNSAKRKL